MKKLLVVIIIILIALISYKNSDRIIRFVVLHSTTLFKTVMVKEMTVEGEEVEVGIDTMGTVDTTDDVVVWTIKK